MSGSGLRVSPYDLIGGIMRYQRMEGSCPERKTMHLPYNIAFFGRVAIRKAKQVPTAPFIWDCLYLSSISTEAHSIINRNISVRGFYGSLNPRLG